MSSIRKVAQEAGVSIATVSRVINGAESVAPGLRRKVLQAVDSCAYKPSVGRRVLESIALVYAGPFTTESPYDSACFSGMVQEVREHQYDLVILDVARDKKPGESLGQFFARKGVRGAVIRSTADERDLVRRWAEERIPLVILGDHFPAEDLRFVFSSSRGASEQAIEHLVSLGHERIVFAACDQEDGDHLDRFLAYQSVMEKHGLKNDALVYRVPPHRFNGIQLLQNVMGAPNRPTAMYIADPLIAVGAVNEAHRLGVRIPTDISLIGFDDKDTRTSVYPKMTAVCQDSYQLGRDAVKELARLIDATSPTGAGVPCHQAWLDIGDTTGPPPSAPQRVLPTKVRVR
ncbi:MAG: LacI family DNA-binding transcriptional regulator [Planctomycetales bacterium]|nr:LacI family DNA-binding transcriptional regulator [Planctomycetales bacterium]